MSSNSLGKIFTFTTWGESHGKAIGCVVDGVPPKISLSTKDIQFYLNKRRPGQSKFTSQRKEKDDLSKRREDHGPIVNPLSRRPQFSQAATTVSHMYVPGARGGRYQ